MPVGGEDVSVQLALVGQKPSFDFEAQDHLALGEALDLIDFETGGTVRLSLLACCRACLLMCDADGNRLARTCCLSSVVGWRACCSS